MTRTRNTFLINDRETRIKNYEWENEQLSKIIDNTPEGTKTNHRARVEKTKNEARIWALQNHLECKV